MTDAPRTAAAGTCPHCNGTFPPEELLATVSAYSADSRVFGTSCPRCGQSLELQVRSGSIELGYTYWAGSMHFEGMVTIRASGLRVVGERDAPVLEYKGVFYPVPAPPPRP